jgi:hypothetical protein
MCAGRPAVMALNACAGGMVRSCGGGGKGGRGKKDAAKKRSFDATMGRRKRYQLQIIQEGTINRECKTLGELETKLRGWTPTPDDDAVFRDGGDDDDGDAAVGA